MRRVTIAKSQVDSQQLDYKVAIERVSESAVYLLDARCRVISWNSGAEAIKGYSAKEVIGRPFFKFYPEKDQSEDKPMQILRQAVRKGSVTEEGWRVRKDGTEFWAYIVTTALFDEQKKVTGFLKIVHNYSENKRLDNQRISLVNTTQKQKKLINKQKAEIKELEKKLQRVSQKQK